MATEIRELHHTDLPRPLIYAAAVTCGVLAAMAVQILLSRAGVEPLRFGTTSSPIMRRNSARRAPGG
jgi:hypothetical protein